MRFSDFVVVKLTALLAISVATSVASAETLQMPPPEPAANGQSGAPWSVPIPSRGQTKAQVESLFGVPQSKQGPIGTPPIYYWEYAKFTVYFESNYVIHSVRKYKAK